MPDADADADATADAGSGGGSDTDDDDRGDARSYTAAGTDPPDQDQSRTRLAEYDDATGERRGAHDLLEQVVSIRSVSGEETEVATHLAAYFEANGRETWIDEVGNLRAPADDGVLLTSHMDTVPGDIPVRVGAAADSAAPALWGRGSVDAKGALTAMAVVAVRTGASFIGVVGEEVDSRGARHVLETGRAEPAAVINGEPSGWDGITLGYRGLLGGTYVCTSESGHTSRPENNAIQDAMDWYRRVESEFATDEWTPVFERVTCKPTSFEGGVSADGLSVEATMDLQLRIPPEYTVAALKERADAALEAGTVRWYDEVPPVMQSPRTPVARAFRAAIRQHDGDPRLLRKTGTSDMNVFAGAWDCPMVTYGPGDSDLDHAPDEHLPLAEFDRAVAVLETVAERLLDRHEERSQNQSQGQRQQPETTGDGDDRGGVQAR